MAENEIVPGKETVVQPNGASWCFHLPEQHRVRIDDEHQLVSISQPDSGSTYELQAIEEGPEEVVVKLGSEVAGHVVGSGAVIDRQPGYRFPQIQDEFERLKGRWIHAGLRETDFNAWAQGASWESHLGEIRRKLRAAGG